MRYLENSIPFSKSFRKLRKWVVLLYRTSWKTFMHDFCLNSSRTIFYVYNNSLRKPLLFKKLGYLTFVKFFVTYKWGLNHSQHWSTPINIFFYLFVYKTVFIKTIVFKIGKKVKLLPNTSTLNKQKFWILHSICEQNF